MKKKILTYILYYSGIFWLKFLWMKIFGSRKLRILCYHRVMDIDPKTFEFDEDLVDATVADFDRQMKFVSKHFNVITFKDLVEYRKKGKLPKNPLIITFDDGYRDNYTNAYPILKKYRLPATIFLTTDYIENKDIFWWDKVAYYIKKTPKKEINFSFNGEICKYDLSNQEKKLFAIKSINKAINKLLRSSKNIEINHILKQLENSLDVKLPPSIIKEHILSWEDIKEMLQDGIEFGSHSVQHQILTNLSDERIEDEIVNSNRKIEQKISQSPIAFAYPTGLYNNNCLKILAKSQVKFGCAYNPTGINSIKFLQENPYKLKRINVDYDYNIIMFKVSLIFSMLRGIKVTTKNNEL
jgi:peptidoglycan/xylan/chitin deacetylase (PgdA/CDA1 family)